MCGPKPAQLQFSPALLAHSEVLGLLVDLAFRQQGGGHDHLHLLHLLDGLGAQGAHRCLQAAQQVVGAVVQLGRAAQDALCLLYTSPSPRDGLLSRMPSSA